MRFVSLIMPLTVYHQVVLSVLITAVHMHVLKSGTGLKQIKLCISTFLWLLILTRSQEMHIF